jgi:hypothetical protein
MLIGVVALRHDQPATTILPHSRGAAARFGSP